MRAAKPIVLAIIVSAALVRAAQGQTSRDDPESPPDGVQVRAGYEVHRDHFRYTFENPSNIDTDFPVPHSFTQRYVADNQWIFGSARYSVRDDVMQTEFAITPERQTPGSDLDTFYDPNHDVVVSGTSGDVMLRSLRFAQWSEGRLFGLPWRVGYVYRRDRSQFLPTDRIVTHSNPQSEARSPTFGHETTISHVHEIPIEVSRAWNVSAWRLVPRAEVSPLILGATDDQTAGQISRTEHHLRCEVCWGRWWDSGGAATRLADRVHAALRTDLGVPSGKTIPPRQSGGGGDGWDSESVTGNR